MNGRTERAIDRLRREQAECESRARAAKRTREAALEYADKRKWADKKFGDEKRAGPPPPRGT